VDARVGRGIDLAHIHVDALRDFPADRALVARLGGRTFDAVQRLREDARGRRFADAANAGEEIRVMDALSLDRVLQRADDRLLSDDVAEGLRPVFARERLVGHVAWSLGGGAEENQPYASCSASAI